VFAKGHSFRKVCTSTAAMNGVSRPGWLGRRSIETPHNFALASIVFEEVPISAASTLIGNQSFRNP
jgi:hypothetical protein